MKETKVNNPIAHTYELDNFQGDVGVAFGVVPECVGVA